MLPCVTVGVISSAGDGLVLCGGVFLVQGVLMSSLERKSVDTSPPVRSVLTAMGLGLRSLGSTWKCVSPLGNPRTSTPPLLVGV